VQDCFTSNPLPSHLTQHCEKNFHEFPNSVGQVNWLCQNTGLDPLNLGSTLGFVEPGGLYWAGTADGTTGTAGLPYLGTVAGTLSSAYTGQAPVCGNPGPQDTREVIAVQATARGCSGVSSGNFCSVPKLLTIGDGLTVDSLADLV